MDHTGPAIWLMQVGGAHHATQAQGHKSCITMARGCTEMCVRGGGIRSSNVNNGEQRWVEAQSSQAGRPCPRQAGMPCPRQAVLKAGRQAVSEAGRPESGTGEGNSLLSLGGTHAQQLASPQLRKPSPPITYSRPPLPPVCPSPSPHSRPTPTSPRPAPPACRGTLASPPPPYFAGTSASGLAVLRGSASLHGPRPKYMVATSKYSCRLFHMYEPLNVRCSRGPRKTPFSKLSSLPSNFCGTAHVTQRSK